MQKLTIARVYTKVANCDSANVKKILVIDRVAYFIIVYIRVNIENQLLL